MQHVDHATQNTPSAPRSHQPIPLLDVSRENQPLEPEILAAIADVCRSGKFVLGPACEELEQQIAARCQSRHAIGCASGSDALLLALMALEIGAGDEVIVPSFTFFATASAVWRVGARPVFVDIDPQTFNLDPLCVRQAVTSATRAIIPVHLFGQAADMDAINQIAKEHHLAVIEDAAQAIGARLHDRPVGSLGTVACISFYPTKNLGGFGDGGMLTTSDDGLAEKLRLLRGHGMHPRYYHQMVGINSRLDSIQAAVLNVKLPQLDAWSAARRENAARYEQLLQDAHLDQVLCLPKSMHDRQHVWNQYTVRVPAGQRDELRRYLSDAGIGTEVYYPVPLHRQECFRSLDYPPGSLPETERAAAEVVSLPIFPELTADEQRTIVERIGEYFAAAATQTRRQVA